VITARARESTACARAQTVYGPHPMRPGPLTFALALALCLGRDVEAQDQGPWKRKIENTFAFVLNPLGIQDASTSPPRSRPGRAPGWPV
jgi:hypothetical protein